MRPAQPDTPKMHHGSAYAPTLPTPRRPGTNVCGPHLFCSSAPLQATLPKLSEKYRPRRLCLPGSRSHLGTRAPWRRSTRGQEVVRERSRTECGQLSAPPHSGFGKAVAPRFCRDSMRNFAIFRWYSVNRNGWSKLSPSSREKLTPVFFLYKQEVGQPSPSSGRVSDDPDAAVVQGAPGGGSYNQ